MKFFAIHLAVFLAIVALTLADDSKGGQLSS